MQYTLIIGALSRKVMQELLIRNTTERRRGGKTAVLVIK